MNRSVSGTPASRQGPSADRQKRAAISYFERWGQHGRKETRAKHQAALRESSRLTPLVEAKLLKSWED